MAPGAVYHFAIIISKVAKVYPFMLFQKSLCLEKSACMIYRKNLNRISGHRVCSEHFVGGKRHDSNVFTIVPEAAKPTVIKERKSRNSFGLIEKNNHSV